MQGGTHTAVIAFANDELARVVNAFNVVVDRVLEEGRPVVDVVDDVMNDGIRNSVLLAVDAQVKLESSHIQVLKANQC